MKCQTLIFMSRTKSCWLIREAKISASWITLGGSAVISAAFKPRKENTSVVIILIANFNRSALGFHQPHHSAFLQSILDSADTYTPLALHQCHHCGCAEPPCAGSPHSGRETPADTAPDSVWQTEWTPANSREYIIDTPLGLKQWWAHRIPVFALLCLCWLKRCFTNEQKRIEPLGIWIILFFFFHFKERSGKAEHISP